MWTVACERGQGFERDGSASAAAPAPDARADRGGGGGGRAAGQSAPPGRGLSVRSRRPLRSSTRSAAAILGGVAHVSSAGGKGSKGLPVLVLLEKAREKPRGRLREGALCCTHTARLPLPFSRRINRAPACDQTFSSNRRLSARFSSTTLSTRLLRAHTHSAPHSSARQQQQPDRTSP